MTRPIAFRGEKCIVAYAVCLNRTSPGLTFYEEQSERDQAKLNKLFQWLGTQGWIKNKEKFKPIEGTSFFEFKEFQIRMPCFRVGSLMVITHGFKKKKGPITAQEIARAERIKGEDEVVSRDRPLALGMSANR